MKKKLQRTLKIGALLAATAIVQPAWSAQKYMPSGGATSQPIGHFDFCASNPGECSAIGGAAAPVELTRKLWSRIIDVNNRINVMVAPATDMEMWGREELWSYPDGQGDCEDYALEKRRALIAAGIPESSLFMTVVRQRNGDGHAVLTVRTDLGDYILDNLEPRVLAWNQTEYTFLKHQSAKNAGKWVSVKDSREQSVGSVR